MRISRLEVQHANRRLLFGTKAIVRGEIECPLESINFSGIKIGGLWNGLAQRRLVQKTAVGKDSCGLHTEYRCFVRGMNALVQCLPDRLVFQPPEHRFGSAVREQDPAALTTSPEFRWPRASHGQASPISSRARPGILSLHADFAGARRQCRSKRRVRQVPYRR